MNGFPGLDGGGAVRMRMVQGENDVTRSHLLYNICKSFDVESINRLFIGFLVALSGLGEVRPMKHHPVTRLYKPIGIRSMGADSFFQRNDCGTARDGKNLQASEANHSTPLWSGDLDGNRVYSPRQMQVAVQPDPFKIKKPATLRLVINTFGDFELDFNGTGPGANLQFEVWDGDCAGKEYIELTFLRNSNIPLHVA